MKDRKSSGSRQQGDMGRQGYGQQSQQISRDDRQNKGSSKPADRHNSAHRSQQR